MDTEAHHHGAPAQAPQAEDCIVLAPRSGALHEALRSRLDDRGWRPVVVDDPHLAMAELCLREHARHTRGAADVSKAEAPVLVLARAAAGGGIAGLRDMLEAIRRWLPDASVWLYANEELLPLIGSKINLGEQDDQPDPARGPARMAGSSPAPRALRLTEPIAAGEETTDANVSSDDGADDDEEAQCRITAEEIEMLLQREPAPDEHAGP